MVIYVILCNLGTHCNLCYQPKCIYYLHPTAKVMFSSLLVVFFWRGGGMWNLVPETIWNIYGMFRLTPWTHEMFFNIFAEIRVCKQHYGKMNERIVMKFSANFAHEARNVQGTIWVLKTGSLFDILDLWLLEILWKSGQTDYPEIFMKCWGQHEKW